MPAGMAVASASSTSKRTSSLAWTARNSRPSPVTIGASE